MRGESVQTYGIAFDAAVCARPLSEFRPEELAGFSECFVTGSAAEVTPVAEIGEYTFRPGNISLSLMDDYAKMVRRELVSA